MKHRIFAVLAAVLLAVVMTLPVCANAEAGPDLTVMIPNAPEDLTVTAVLPDGAAAPMHLRRRGWESCYRLYYSRIYEAMYPDGRTELERVTAMEKAISQLTLRMVSRSEGLDFTIPMPGANQLMYNHLAVLTLDREGNTAAEVNSSYMVWRNVLLVVLRVTVTLITEGVIFRLMNYRTRRSWLIFGITNLATQLFLNITITGNYLAVGYWEIGFFVMEGLIFLTEGIVYAALLRERSRLCGFTAAVLANAVSLVCGWALLTGLPL